ncbi:MAG TPA: hypothetical protein VF111_05655 [Thermoanaerobaculia bacterium]
MSKYDKELDSSRPEYDKAIEPLERETHEVPPPPRDHQRDDEHREDDRDRQ